MALCGMGLRGGRAPIERIVHGGIQNLMIGWLDDSMRRAGRHGGIGAGSLDGDSAAWNRAIFFVPCDCHGLFAERCCRFHAEVFFGAIGLSRVAEESRGVTTALSQVQKLAQ